MSPSLILLVVVSALLLLWGLLRLAAVLAGLVGIVETRYTETDIEDRDPRQRLLGLLLLTLAVIGLTVFIISLAASPPV